MKDITIDTIRLKITATDFKEDFLTSISCEKTGFLRYKIFKDSITVGSFSYDLNIFVNNDRFIFLDFSLGKLKNGHNLNNFSINEVYEQLQQIQVSLGQFCSPSPCEEWEVQRIDLCHFIDCFNPAWDIRYYQLIDYPRKKKYIYDSSVMFVGNSFSCKFYVKYDEFLKNDFKKIRLYDYNKALRLLNYTKNKIRFETSYRKKSLTYITKYDILTVKKLLHSYQKIYNHYNNLFNSLILKINTNKMQQKKLLPLLQSKYKPNRAIQLYMFWQLYTSEPERQLLKQMYSRSQIYRNLKAIQSIII